MNSMVGMILLAAFLAFAVLMFVERLSALLALPLMALAFMLISVVADLLAPATVTQAVPVTTVDAVGRTQVTLVSESRSSRFAAWKQLQSARSQWLHRKARFLQEAVERLRSIAGPSGIAELSDETRAELIAEAHRIHAAEVELGGQMEAAWGKLPDPFEQSGPGSAVRADFDSAWKAITADEVLGPLVSLLEQPGSGARADRVHGLLADGLARAGAALAHHGAPAEASAPAAGWEYLYRHLVNVLRSGSLMLHATIIASLFGGMFAAYVRNLKIAERMVYWTAEFAGERPFVVCLAVMLITAVIFTSVGGLGTVIMLGAIILPVLRSIGMGAIFATGTLLIGIGMGGTLYPVSRRLWLDFFGIPAPLLDAMLWTVVLLYFACGVVWVFWGTRGKALSNFLAVAAEAAAPEQGVPLRLMLAPILPVALVYFLHLEEITTFCVSIAYMFLCVARRPGSVRLLCRSLIEGAQLVVPPILLMLGIGMLLASLFTAPVQAYLRPVLSAVVPGSRWAYILTFALAAPLALYRGPLNVWGMGLAVSGTLMAASSLPPAAILGVILSAGMLQSVCDPTNTANVWLAGFQGLSVNRILRATIVPVWSAAIVLVIIFGFWFVS